MEFLDDDFLKAPPKAAAAAAPRPLKLDKDHQVPWLCTLIPHRLLVGPFPSRKEDLYHLVHELGVTHMINMCVETDKTTQKGGLNKASWYTCYFNKLIGIDPHMIRLPLPADFTLWSETKQIEFYLSSAKILCGHLKEDDKATLYVHNKSGFAEEAMTSLLAWRLFDKVKFPENVQEWLRKNMFERVLDSEDQMALLKRAVEKSKSLEKGGMDKWIVKRQKTNA